MIRYKIFDPLRGRLYPDNPDTGDLPLINLAYLGFLFLPLLRNDSLSLGATVLSVALFLPLNFWGWQRKQLPLVTLAIWSLWIIFARYNWGANVYVIYACAFAAFIPSPRQALGLFLLILSGTFMLLYYWQAPPIAFGPLYLIACMVYLGNRSGFEALRRQSMLRISHQEIGKLAQRSERERIARDIHDLLGHSLTVIALKADLAGKLMDVEPTKARAELEELRQIARDALGEVRATVHGMRSAQIGVEVAKSRVACEAAGIQLRVDISETAISRELEEALASVLREAVNNCIKHAHASQLSIQLMVSDGRATLIIKDDGRNKTIKEGHGIFAMRERIAEVGGNLAIRWRDGFELCAECPIKARATVSIQPSLLPAAP